MVLKTIGSFLFKSAVLVEASFTERKEGEGSVSFVEQLQVRQVIKQTMTGKLMVNTFFIIIEFVL